MLQQVLQQLLVDAAAAHLDRGVLGPGRHGVLDEQSFVIQQPMFGPPAVHDDSTTPFVDGFAPDQRFGAVEEIQYFETTFGRQRVAALPRIGHERRLPSRQAIRPTTRLRRRSSAPSVRSAATSSE